MYLSSTQFRSIFTRLILLSFAPFVFSCSGNPVDDNSGSSGPVTLTVSPASAAPGVTLTVSGATVDTSALASYRLLIGGQQVLLLTDTLGSVSGIAPAFFKDSTSTWPSPSVAPVDIELFKDTVLVGRGVGVFTSDSLIQVPGSTQKLVNNVIATVESYQSILAALPTEPGIFEQLTVAMTDALDSLIYGRGDSSLSALLTDLQTNNPSALAYLDAIYASNGSSDQSQAIADAIAAIAASFNSGGVRRSAIIVDDVRLAATMQLASMLKLFGDSFIHDAAGTAGNISFGLGLVPEAGLIPGFRVIALFATTTSTVISMIDLIFNKIIVASLPTVIDSFTITLTADTIAVGDTTVSSLRVYARNSPPQITLGDLLSQFSGIIGLFSNSTTASTLLEDLEGVLNYLLGQLNNSLQAYAAANPDFSYEPIFFDIAGMPIIHREAEIVDPRLLQLNVLSPKLAAIDSLLEWRSTGDLGSASVTISPSFDQDATVIPIPSFLGYVGSSFGVLSDSSAVISASKQVTVQSRLAVLVDFANVISRDGANVLGVRAGRIGILGDTTWTSGLNVTLTAIGGGADPATGTTDVNGQFSSLVSLDPFSDTVKVDVRVRESFGGFAASEVMAIVEQTNIQDTIPRIAYKKRISGINETLWTIYPFDTTKNDKIVTLSSNSRADKLLWAPGYTMFSYRDINNSVQYWIANTNKTKKRIGQDLSFSSSTTFVNWPETDSSRFVYSGGIINGVQQVFTENVFTNNRDTLFDLIVRDNSIPTFSPDGQFIAYATRTTSSSYTIYRSNADGSNEISLAVISEAGSVVGELVWSADGSNVIFNHYTGGSTPRILYKVTSNGDPLQTMVSFPILTNLHTVPGTRKVIYTAGPTGTSIKDGIYILDIDNLSNQIIPNTESLRTSAIDISPDGLHVCFEEGGNIFIVELATGTRTQITSDGNNYFPTWSRW